MRTLVLTLTAALTLSLAGAQVPDSAAIPSLDKYGNKYANLRLERTPDGVLTVTMHTRGGPFVFDANAHREFVQAFHDIASDRANKVVILTGSGDAWLNRIDFASFGDLSNPQNWDTVYWEGKRLLENFLEIEVPVIAAINGPATVHTEWMLASDLIVASDTAEFQDAPHILGGIVPGDGVNVLWPAVLGPVRGNYFLWTGQKLSAPQALNLGVVSEVVPRSQVMPRAREMAAQLLKVPELTRRYTRAILTLKLRRELAEAVGPGLSLEGTSAADLFRQMQNQKK